MNKTKFLELVKNPDLIEEQDLVKLDELISEHPYSQIVHILKVKGHKVFNNPDFNDSLNLAATYIYDRNILRSILEGPRVAEYNSGAIPENVPETEDNTIEEVSDFDWIQQDDDDDIFVDEINERLTQSEKDTVTKMPDKEEEPLPDPEPEAQTPADEAIESQTPLGTEEKESGLADTPETDPLQLEIEAGSIHAELMKNLNQLQESKQRFDEQPTSNPGPENRDHQIEIIDNFIKNSPVLSKPGLNAESEGTSQQDLAEESARFNEELVTENLARIYLQQGKGKDAAKIYKKLIRKFPQKKAYFADQIRKIKKK